MEKIVSLAKTRGFVFPGSDIYGGLANSWDYGPLGVELKNNIKQLWWKMFVQERLDMVGIDAALIMNPKVWEASGHIATFSDPLVECKTCHERYRADQIDRVAPCQKCGNKETFTEPASFNLMMKTWLGPKEDVSAVAYFRPETAQAMFVDFPNVLTSSRKRVPFGMAQIGKAFRNEITPGNFIFRTREFEQMEIEYFVHPSEWEARFEEWLANMYALMHLDRTILKLQRMSSRTSQSARSTLNSIIHSDAKNCTDSRIARILISPRTQNIPDQIWCTQIQSPMRNMFHM